MSKTRQIYGPKVRYTPFMLDSIHVLTTERDGDDGLIVTFSDGTTGAYVVEEPLELRPFRERIETKKTQNSPKNK
jgi:hypothetical protein